MEKKTIWGRKTRPYIGEHRATNHRTKLVQLHMKHIRACATSLGSNSGQSEGVVAFWEFLQLWLRLARGWFGTSGWHVVTCSRRIRKRGDAIGSRVTHRIV